MRSNFNYDPPPLSHDWVYEDDDLLVIDKPAGLLSVPGRQAQHKDSLLSRLEEIFAAVFLVHRLDMDTSGLMVFGKTKAAQRHLGQQFETRRVEKTYLAEIAGTPHENAGEINLPLMADWPNRPLQKVDTAGKPALTRWKVLEQREHSTIVALSPLTGRSHQLRVHMAAIGHPILGDPFYAPPEVQALADRLHLHAASLSLFHPVTQAPQTFTSACSFFQALEDNTKQG